MRTTTSRRLRWTGAIALAAAIALSLRAPRAAAQTGVTDATAALGVHEQTLNFAAGSDVQSARLLLLPFAYQARLAPTIVLDGYAAYASGTVRANQQQFQLNGPVDSWLRVRWAAKPWAELAVGASLPTGVATHTPAQTVVANVLSNDLLGFREGNWGAGGSVTAGASAVRRLGAVRTTLGLSYRMVGSFDPRADTSVRYSPGNETRARLGFDWAAVGGQFQGGLTAQSFSVDRLDSKNLFQSGKRLRADLSYGRGAFSIYGADLLRQRGELTLPVVNILDGTVERDTTTTEGWQNLLLGGASATLALPSGVMLEPLVEAKARQRQDGVGQGWLTSAGATVSFHAGGLDWFPTAKVTRGAMVASNGGPERAIWGGEVSVVLRRAWVRGR